MKKCWAILFEYLPHLGLDLDGGGGLDGGMLPLKGCGRRGEAVCCGSLSSLSSFESARCSSKSDLSFAFGFPGIVPSTWVVTLRSSAKLASGVYRLLQAAARQSPQLDHS